LVISLFLSYATIELLKRKTVHAKEITNCILQLVKLHLFPGFKTGTKMNIKYWTMRRQFGKKEEIHLIRDGVTTLASRNSALFPSEI
jgi:hypothetical protein